MKKLLFIVSLALGLTSILYSQNINGRITSALYTFERFDTLENSTTHARTFQMLYLNFGVKNIALRTNLNLESDVAEDISYDPRLRVYNLYVDVRNIFDLIYLKVGRQSVYNVAGGGVFDGFSLGVKYHGFDINGYYGGNVPAYQKLELTDDFKNDYVAGGKLTVNALTNTRIALRYVNKNFKTIPYSARREDLNLIDITKLIDNVSQQFEYLSGEISYDQPKEFRINTRYDYDLNFEKTSKFEISGRYERIEKLGLSLYYNYREPKIRYNSIFSVFDYRNSQEIEFGGDYLVSPTVKVIGKFANVTFDDESSQRISLGLSSTLGSVTARKTFGYAGELTAISLYTARSFLDGLITPSLSLGYTSYKLSSANDTNEMISALLGLNYRPYRTLSFDVQGQFLNNKIYANDFRLLLKLNFWFNTNF